MITSSQNLNHEDVYFSLSKLTVVVAVCKHQTIPLNKPPPASKLFAQDSIHGSIFPLPRRLGQIHFLMHGFKFQESQFL